MAPAGTLYHSCGNNFRTLQILIAASYSGTSVDVNPKREFVVASRLGDFVKKLPLVPVFQSKDESVILFESDAIAYYVANDTLRGGKGAVERSQVLQWIMFAQSELLFPSRSLVSLNRDQVAKARSETERYITALDEYLESRTYLVGEGVTLADITVFAVLTHLYKDLLDADSMKQFINVNRWFDTVMNEDKVQDAINKCKYNLSCFKTSKNQPSSSSSVLIKAEKKREAWIDPDVINEKRSQEKQQKKLSTQPNLHSFISPMPKPKVEVSKSESQQYNRSTTRGSFSKNQPPFVIKVEKKREAWIDPDIINEKRSQQNQQKKYSRQPILQSFISAMPRPKVDISKSKQYNGGSWVSSQATSQSSVETIPVVDTKVGMKRKSDESVEGDDKRDKLELRDFDLSLTMFNSPTKDTSVSGHSSPVQPSPIVGDADSSLTMYISPTKEMPTSDHSSPISPIEHDVDLSLTMYNSPTKDKDSSIFEYSSPLSPIVGVPQRNEDVKICKQKQRSPLSLSPGKMNIVEPEIPQSSKSAGSRINLDSTMNNIFRDYDKIPDYKTPSPQKLGRKKGKKGKDFDEPQKKCTCTPPDLAQQIDKREVERNKEKCEIHGTKATGYEPPPLNDFETPPHYWRTQLHTTQELYEGGYIKEGSPFIPKPPRRRRRYSNETFVYGDTDSDDTDTENHYFDS